MEQAVTQLDVKILFDDLLITLTYVTLSDLWNLVTTSRSTETDLAWSSSIEDVRIMVRHEACPPGGNLVLMCAVVSNSASAVP